MTNDTIRALDAIRPIAAELNIEVRADHDFLYCNGQAIGIGCNSTYATVLEFLAYCMVWMSQHEYRYKELPPDFAKALKRYWFSKAQIEKMHLNRANEGGE